MSIQVYFDALERLESNKPIRVPPNTKINNDNVSLEAGRKKGSIRKERSEFDSLREQIKLAAARQFKKSDVAVLREKVAKLKEEFAVLELRLFESYNREVLLISRLATLEKDLDLANYDNVVLFKRKAPEEDSES